MQEFKKFSIEKIPRSENSHIDALSRLALACPCQIDQIVYSEMEKVTSIAEGEVMMQ